MDVERNYTPLKEAKSAFETQCIQKALKENDYRLRKAAEALDIHYSALLNKMKQKGIKREVSRHES